MSARRHHYVWRKYLEAWAEDGKVWCLRRGSDVPFQANPANLGVERDFYQLDDMGPEDFEFVLIRAKPYLRRVARDLIGHGRCYGTYLQQTFGSLVEEIELYYPVSPHRAIIFSDRPVYMRSEGSPLSAVHTSYLNQVVENSAHEQLFAKFKASLMQPAMAFRGPRPW